MLPRRLRQPIAVFAMATGFYPLLLQLRALAGITLLGGPLPLLIGVLACSAAGWTLVVFIQAGKPVLLAIVLLALGGGLNFTVGYLVVGYIWSLP